METSDAWVGIRVHAFLRLPSLRGLALQQCVHRRDEPVGGHGLVESALRPEALRDIEKIHVHHPAAAGDRDDLDLGELSVEPRDGFQAILLWHEDVGNDYELRDWQAAHLLTAAPLL
jgi:hypothetical protein